MDPEFSDVDLSPYVVPPTDPKLALWAALADKTSSALIDETGATEAHISDRLGYIDVEVADPQQQPNDLEARIRRRIPAGASVSVHSDPSTGTLSAHVHKQDNFAWYNRFSVGLWVQLIATVVSLVVLAHFIWRRV